MKRTVTRIMLFGVSLGLAVGCGPKTKIIIKPDGTKVEVPVDDTKKEEDLETVFHQAEVKAPEYVEGVKHEAQDHFRRGVQLAHEVPPKYEEALVEFEKAITLEKEFLEPYFNIAMTYERQRKPGLALKTYQRALKANPESADAQAFIGKIYLANAKKLFYFGKTAQAEELMRKGKALFDGVIARDYENVPANNALALFWLLRNKPGKAEEFVKQVLTIQPQNVTALNTRGLIFLQAGQINFARWIFEQKVLTLDANSIEAHTNLGRVFVIEKNLPRAVKHFTRSVGLDKSNVEARMNLGAIYIDFLNYAHAKEQFATVLDIQPDNVDAVIGLASATLGEGKFKDAVEGYEKALKMDSRRAILLFRIGKLYEDKFGQKEAGLKTAISYYERYAKAANLPPTHKLVKKIPVLKEVISSGMLKQPATPKAPEGDKTAPEGDKTAPEGDKAPKAGEKKADEKAPEKKADEKKADEKAPEKKADEKKADEKAEKTDDGKTAPEPAAKKEAPKAGAEKKDDSK